jgi:glc operon protein GlcG
MQELLMHCATRIAACLLACALGLPAAAQDQAQAQAALAPRPGANISLEQAQRVVATAIAHAKKLGTVLAIVVVDTGGQVVSAARMDGAPFGTFDVARGKAIASVATGGESGKALMERYKANPIVFGQISSLSYGGPMFPSQGSLPIFYNGTLIGAAAGSGASSQIDEDAARAGIAAIGASELRPQP